MVGISFLYNMLAVIKPTKANNAPVFPFFCVNGLVTKMLSSFPIWLCLLTKTRIGLHVMEDLRPSVVNAPVRRLCKSRWAAESPLMSFEMLCASAILPFFFPERARHGVDFASLLLMLAVGGVVLWTSC